MPSPRIGRSCSDPDQDIELSETRFVDLPELEEVGWTELLLGDLLPVLL